MTKTGLKNLFVAFSGDTGKINFFLKEFGGDAKLATALKKVKWDVSKLEVAIMTKRKRLADARDKAYNDGQQNRDAEAEKQAGQIIADDKLANQAVQDLLKDYMKLEKDYLASPTADPKYAPDLSFMEMAPPKRVGPESLKMPADPDPFYDQLMAAEPLIKLSTRGHELLVKARQLQGSLPDADPKPSKGDLAKVDDIESWLSKMTAEMGEKYNKAAPGPQKMAFSEQNMVPSASNLEAADQRTETSERLHTADQGWALAGAEIKGEEELALNRIKALERLIAIGKKFGANYGEKHLDAVLAHIAKGKLATNFRFDKAAGKQELPGIGESPEDFKARMASRTKLGQLMRENPSFKNVWQTGTSQASEDTTRRGAVEEGMGYSHTLGREKGTAQDQYSEKPDFRVERDGTDEDKGAMPNYAAVVSDGQTHGVALRYGNCYVVWKDEVGERVTHTPGDSWNLEEQGVKNFTSNAHPEVILAHADEELVRVAAAEATGKDQDFLSQVAKSGLTTESYIETQIHGDLDWFDVKELVLGADTQEEIDQMEREFKAFKKTGPYDFKITCKS